MNVMTQAHKITRATVDASPVKLSYRSLFRAALIDLHKKAKEMNQAEMLRLDTIAKFEKRIAELQNILTTPDAQKFMVVCGDEHPMPINFEATNPKWPWATVEGATKWNSVQFANANASKVVNGNREVGKVVKVSEHVEWDIAQLETLVKGLKGEK